MKLTLTLVANLVFTFGMTATANDERESPERETVAEDITPDVGPVVRGRELLQRSIHDGDDQQIGDVVDLVIDPYWGKVALIVVHTKSKNDNGQRIVIPLELVAPFQTTNMKTSIAASEIEKKDTLIRNGESEPLTRKAIGDVFERYDVKPYWHGKAQDGHRDKERFVVFTEIQQQTVKTPAGEKLGRIDDVVFSEKDGKIVYTLFAHNHEKAHKTETRTFPIPLAAFVVPPESDRWLLELPETILDNTEDIKGSALPKQVSRGWVEYIHVRYGAGVFDGVQRSLKQAGRQ